MKNILFFFLVFGLLGVAGCGDSPELTECRQYRAALEAQKKELIAKVQSLNDKVDAMRETLRKKHEEVNLHKQLPQMADRKVVGVERENRLLEEQFEELQLKYETLLRRYDSQQRKLMECQQRVTSGQ